MKESFAEIKQFLDARQVTLVAVTKTTPPEEIEKVYGQGQRIFGENRVNEMLDKYEVMSKEIEWHLVGHLQTNKVKYIVPFVSLIHSVDSWKLLEEIEKHAKNQQRTIDILVEIHIATEETKFGLSVEEARKLLTNNSLEDFENVRIRGLMGIASLTRNQDQIKKEFQSLKTFYDEVRFKLINVSLMSDIMPSKALKIDDFNILSMGMSNDYKLAIEEGSNMVRIGSAIFGERKVNKKERHRL